MRPPGPGPEGEAGISSGIQKNWTMRDLGSRGCLAGRKKPGAPGLTLVRVHLWKRNLPHLGIPQGFAGGTDGIEHICQCRRHRDPGSISGLGRYPGGGNGKPLQYSCLENSMDRGAW